ncbi:MAG TPA: glycosyltransferase family 4 protein [bacterium]|nr:glycosyltransferase family 4 protein [bacterium]
MKVLLINKYFYLKGGAEKHFFSVRKMLQARGFEVVDFATQDKNNLSSPTEKYFVSPVASGKLFSFSSLKTLGRLLWSFEARKKIKKLIVEERPQVAHLHNIYHQISPSILPILKKNKIPVIMTVHDLALISPSINMFANGKIYDKVIGQHYYRCLKDKCIENSFWFSLAGVLEMYFHHKILNIYQKNIDFFICPSSFLAKMLIQAGFDKNKIYILPNFVEAEQILPTTKNEKYLLYFSRLSAEKGIHILLEAMKNIPEVKLKVVGTGPEELSCQLKIKKYGLKNIELLGYQTGTNLLKLIANSYAVVVPSVCYENCPLSILESLAFGKPVVASAIGGIPELIINDVNGLLVKAGEPVGLSAALKDIWLDEIKRDRLAGRALETSSQYSADKYFERLLEVYNKSLCQE